MSDSPTETEVSKTVETTENTSVDTGVKADSPPANDGAKADSPPAEDTGAKKSLADVIHDVVNKPAEVSPPPKTDDPNKAADPVDTPEKELTEAEAPELTKEEMGQLSQKTARRMRYLTDKIEAESNKAKAFEPEVQEYRKFKTFLQTNRVSPEDATTALELAAAINNDPRIALQELEPIVQRLREQTGAVLPADLAAQVEAGYITEAVAKETASLRATVRLKEDREIRDTTEAQQLRQDAVKQATGSIQKAVSDWETSWAKGDADYPKLRSEVDIEINGRLALAKREGKLPQTPQEAVALAKDCLKVVKERKLRAAPPKEEIKHISGRSAASVDKKPRAPDLASHILQLGI